MVTAGSCSEDAGRHNHGELDKVGCEIIQPKSLGLVFVHGSYVQLGMTTVVQSLERGSDTEVGTRLWLRPPQKVPSRSV